MESKLIHFEDAPSIHIEVSVGDNEARQIASIFSDQVRGHFQEKLIPITKEILDSISSLQAEIKKNVNLYESEIELGLSFETEGNIYITKSTLGANLIVKFKFKH